MKIKNKSIIVHHPSLAMCTSITPSRPILLPVPTLAIVVASWWRCCLGHSKNLCDDDDDDDDDPICIKRGSDGMIPFAA